MPKVRAIQGVTKKRVSIVHTREPRRVKLWAYGYESLASLFNVSPDVVRQWVTRGQLKPGELESVCRLWMQKTQKDGAQ